LEDLDRAIGLNAESAFSFLGELVAAESVLGREQGALNVFSRELEELGFVTERLPFSNLPLNDRRAGGAQPPEGLSADRFQVLASSAGDAPFTLMLNGHMDVVPALTPQLWTTPPFTPTRRNGRLYGRGAADMKSGFAIGVLALRAVLAVVPRLFDRQRLGFLAVIEEECTGNGTLRSLVDHNIHADEVVLLEPTDLGLMLGGVGVLWMDINVVAASSHAQSAQAKTNAVDLGMLLVDALRRWSAELAVTNPEPSMSPTESPYNVNLGAVHAGDWTSTAPAHAVFSVRVGYPRAWTAEEAETAVCAVIAATADAHDAFPVRPRVTFSGLRAEGYLLDQASPLVADLSAAHQAAHGILPATFTLGSTTDARTYLNNFAIPAVCFGAVAHDMHGIDESVELQSIVDAARTLSRFILMRFGGSAAP